jgi:hypothetical protein
MGLDASREAARDRRRCTPTPTALLGPPRLVDCIWIVLADGTLFIREVAALTVEHGHHDMDGGIRPRWRMGSARALKFFRKRSIPTDGCRVGSGRTVRDAAPRCAIALLCWFATAAGCRYGYDPLAGPEGGDGAPDGSVGQSDSGVLDAGTPDASCDPTAPLADDFSSVVPDRRWVPFGTSGASVSITNGRVRVDLPRSGLTKAYAGLVTDGPYDLSGKRLSIEVPTMVNTSGHAQALVQLLDTEGAVTYTAGFEQQNGSLHAFVHGAGAPGDQFVVYDSLAHHYWQVRESAGTLFFETSPDGTTWTTVLASSAVFDSTRARIELSAGIYQPEVLPGAAEFDNLGGTVELGTSCKPR